MDWQIFLKTAFINSRTSRHILAEQYLKLRPMEAETRASWNINLVQRLTTGQPLVTLNFDREYRVVLEKISKIAEIRNTGIILLIRFSLEP